MPETINRRCPQCGRKAHDRLLLQCPDCRVPFVLDESAAPPTLTPEQLRLLATQVFGSWKFWAVLLVVVAGAAWAIVNVADRVIDARAKVYLGKLEREASNHIGRATSQISNQIVEQFRDPRIQDAIENAARTRAAEIITNGVRPTLDAFLDAMDAASAQLNKSSNTIAQLQRDALAAQKRIPPATVAQVDPTPPPAATNAPTPAVAPTTPAPAPTPAATPPSGNAQLRLVNYNVVPSPTGYILTMLFRVANGGGSVDMLAGTFRQTAKILNYSAVTATPAGAPVFTDTADAGRLQFSVNANENPTVVLQLSAPTIVRVESPELDNALTIPVAADQMQLPAASNKPTN